MNFGNNPIVYLTKKTWEYSKGNRGQVVLYIILFLFANVASFFEPLVVGSILNIIQEQGISMNNIYSIIFFLSFFITLRVGFWLFHGPARVIERGNAFLVRANYKKYLLDGTMALPAEWHTDHHSGDTIDKIGKGTEALFNYSSDTYEVIETILRFLGSYIALTYFNLHSGYIVLFMVFITLTMIIKFDKYLVKQYKEINWAENKISAKIFDVISNITTVIILRIEKLLSKSILKQIMAPFKIFKKNIKLNEVKWFLVSVCSALMTFFILLTYIITNIEIGGVILVGTIYILYGYVQRINQLFFRFAYRYGKIVKERTSVMNSEEISNEFEKKLKIKSIDLSKGWRILKIEDLNFSYDIGKGKKAHLDNISVTIKNKEKIALVGESGSGKTTFLKVMRELYEPKKVNLYLDGKLLKDGFGEISPDITLVPQDPEIFSTTIKENITLGVNYKLEYIKKFTKMACFMNVVEKLPKKFESSIVEKGVNLSSGENQRLALSRGLLACQNKSIILLDEPTSSVDIKNETDIYRNIFKEFKNRTIISSVHKLHLLHLFDKIYFFKKGKIIASGTLKELLKGSKEFKKLWKKNKRVVKR